jgi:hypothetical protein
MKLYLDDIRFPKTTGWDIVRSYEEFIDYINKNGTKDLFISFDHDLADIHYDYPDSNVLNFGEYSENENRERTGYDCAKWLCDYCLINELPIPNWNVHSANPVGKENIDSIMRNYTKKLNI